MILTILGRQPAIGAAELERRYGSDAVKWFSDSALTIETEDFSIQDFGGTQKAGIVSLRLASADWQRVSSKIVQHYSRKWGKFDGKLTIGISAYGFSTTSRDVQKTGLVLKQALKKSGVSVRLIPNNEPAFNTAVSHHNKLGLSDNKIELLVVRARSGSVLVAQSTGAQNITAYARRDQERPKRDAFVGMLPPKLAQIMTNLAVSTTDPKCGGVVLDPFCGTGVILQEARLRGFDVYGSDIEAKMIDFSRHNLRWLLSLLGNKITDETAGQDYFRLEQADAMDHTWSPTPQFIVCEAYLGQPFSAPPSPAKLTQVRQNCDHIITAFLQNIVPQLLPGTPICLAVPAWRDAFGNFAHLPCVQHLDRYGVKRIALKTANADDLIYHRPDQIVARELLLLEKS